jgi:hypothetical protein
MAGVAPTYNWTCHLCDRMNAPGISSCAHCGFSATTSALEIVAAKGEPDPVLEGYKALGAGILGLLIAFGAVFAGHLPEKRRKKP